MLAELPEKSIRTIRDAARRLTGAARRKFEAGVAIDYCQGSPRRTESVFGWGRATVKAGLDELQTGVARLDQFFKRGRRKTEEKLPDLEKDIRRQVEPNCQVDPKFRSPFLYTRMTARAVGEVLLEQAGCRQQWPGDRIGLLPSVSQQVQLGGTLLGNPRTALEWGDLEFTGGSAELGSDDDVERHLPDDTAVGDRVRQGRPSQPKGHAAVRITAVPVTTAWQVERRDFSLD